jgi:hypothetical protein
MDIAFTISFTIELLMKAIAVGFVFDKHSYLRENWNQLDCFIVATSLIDLSITNDSMSSFKVIPGNEF